MNVLYLNERIEKRAAIQYNDTKKSKSQLLKRWHQQMPYRRKLEWFEVKLREEGIDEATFFQLVERPDFQSLTKTSKDYFNPKKTTWRKRFIGQEAGYTHDFYQANNPEVGFLNLVLPVLYDSSRELERRIEAIVATNPQVFESLRQVVGGLQVTLMEKMMRLINKTMVLEFNVFKAQGKLRGDTPEARFADFIQQLKTTKVRDYINRDYPILVRRIAEEADNWLHHSFQFVNRLAKDYNDIVTAFFEGDATQLGTLSFVRFGAGDTHRGGRTVAVVNFSTGQQIVYKPRNLEIDQHFQDLLAWVSEKSAMDFHQTKLISRENYGWMEFIQHTTCSDTEGVKNYYRRIGGYTALLYALEATDFHYENIIAHGEHPVLIDLESFFHPYFPIEGLGTNQGNETTVLRTGLLPQRINLKDDQGSVDISGLTDVEGQQGIVEINVTKGVGSDDAKVVKEYGRLEGGKNVPLLRGDKVTMIEEYETAIAEGFELLYRFFMDNKAEMSNILQKFTNDDVRVLFRNTFVYGHLLEESTHPHILRNGLECDRHFDWLWATVPDYELIKRVVKYEKDDLLRGDVPLFTTKVNSRHLWYGDDQYIENFFDNTGLELIKNRLDKFDETDLTRQLWVVKASLTASSTVKKASLETTKPISLPQISEKAIDFSNLQKQLLAEAQKIGDYLYQHAFIGENEAQWVGLKMEDDNSFQLVPMVQDLFSGLSGEILFLTYLHQTTGIEKYKILAEKALNTLLLRVKHYPDTVRLLGLHTGWGSIIYLLTHLAHLWKRDDLVELVKGFYDKIDFNELLKVDKLYSLVNGSAGFMIANIQFYQTFGEPKALEWAKQAANYLLCEATEYGEGLAWRIASSRPLSGMAHGASGFAVVFDQLFQITNEIKYADVVRRLLIYEQTLFIEADQNWQDCRDMTVRQFPDKAVCAVGWAHGAPGIGLSRLQLQANAHLQVEAINQDLKIAINTTLERGFNRNMNLTMGGFGTLEFLNCYAHIQNDDVVKEKVHSAVQLYLAIITENGWHCGLPNKLVTQGFMSGITGIGYQCLRIAFPDTIPSVLMSEGVVVS